MNWGQFAAVKWGLFGAVKWGLIQSYFHLVKVPAFTFELLYCFRNTLQISLMKHF
jgi:hypothetical protein